MPRSSSNFTSLSNTSIKLDKTLVDEALDFKDLKEGIFPDYIADTSNHLIALTACRRKYLLDVENRKREEDRGFLSEIESDIEGTSKVVRYSISLDAILRNNKDVFAQFLPNLSEDNLKYKSPRGTSLLVVASELDRAEMVSLLMDRKCFSSKDLEDALILTAASGHKKTVGVLLKDEGLAANTDARIGAISKAAANGQAEMVEVLLEGEFQVRKLEIGMGNALVQAAQNGHMQVTLLLLFKGVCREHVLSALEVASENGHQDIFDALLFAKGEDLKIFPEDIKALLDKGCASKVTTSDSAAEVFGSDSAAECRMDSKLVSGGGAAQGDQEELYPNATVSRVEGGKVSGGICGVNL